MTMTEYSQPLSLSLARPLALGGCFQDACRLVSPKPPTLSIIGSRSAAMPTRTANEPAKCIAVADSVRSHTEDDITAEDWDLLFRAALELLACVAAEKPMQNGPALQLQAQGTAFRECLAALDQLRRSVPPLQQQPMRQTPDCAGEIASLAGTGASATGP
jgi:hypothetical protein